MMDIKVIFPDQSQQTHPAGVSVAEAIGSWKKEALATAVAASVNGASVDLNFALAEDAKVEPIDIASKKGLSVLRHSISHVMAQAVQDVFPGAKVTIGPSIEDGFYYDFEYAETFTVDDFEKIEKRIDRKSVV